MSIIIDKNIQKELEGLFTSAFSQGSFAGTSGEDMKFIFSWPPEILTDSDYINPWSASNPGGSMSSVENISMLVDPIPSCHDTYFPSGNSIEEVYGNIILLANPVFEEQDSSFVQNIINTTDSGQIKKDFQSPKNLFYNMINKYEDSNIERILSLKIAQQIISSEKQKKVSLDLEGTKSKLTAVKEKLNLQAEQTLPILKRSILPQLKMTKENEGSIVTRTLSTANKLFESYVVASLNNPKITYHPSIVIPTNFALVSEAEEWGDIDTTIKDENNQDVHISMKYTRADIIRPWFMNSLLWMNGWSIQGQQSGWLSTGNNNNNNGLFPLLTVSFILCRDMEITGQHESYKADGLQIISRCCKVTPKMAPE